MQKPMVYILLLGSISVFLFFIFINFRIHSKVALLNNELKLWQNRQAQTTKQSQQLQNQLEQSNTTAYIERIARESLNLKKPGEKVVVFTKSNPAIATTSTNENKASFWRRVKNIFMIK